MTTDAGQSADLGLDRFLRARSIALVGASERSAWSNMAFGNFKVLGFEGTVHLVNRRGGTVYGLPAATSCAAVGEPIDAALIMVPVEAMAETFADLRSAGVRNAVILAAGFAEAGGEDRQNALLELARRSELTLLGPNCLGFINFVARVPVWTTPIYPQSRPGSIALVSQSGATAAYIASFARESGIDFSHIVSTGNEADLNAARVVRYLIEDPSVRAIAMFLESVRDREVLGEAAELARAARKPIVVLKVGASVVGAQVAQAHTGSLVGDDRVFDAACRRLGLVRVRSIEDLVFTAALLSHIEPVKRRSLGAVAISGGVCELAADRAAAEDIELSALATHTLDELRRILPEFGTANNPLDVTGAAVLDPTIFDRCVAALASDPEVGLITCFADVAPTGPSPVEQQMFEHIAMGLTRAEGAAGLVMSVTPRTVNAAVRDLVNAAAVFYLPSGVQHGLCAVGAAFRWSEWLESPLAGGAARPVDSRRPLSERHTLDYLQERGLCVVPTVLAVCVDQGVAAAASFAQPVAMKIASADIAHKTDLGCVKLGVSGAAAVAEAYRVIEANALKGSPGARIDGISVAPMRSGLELFIGTLRDPQWGVVITVGLGGVWVEALKDTSLRLLPVDLNEALAMLDELRGARLLDGFRGAPAVDRLAVARAIVQVGEAALALGPDLESLEVNPLLAGPGGVEALDALTVWRQR